MGSCNSKVDSTKSKMYQLQDMGEHEGGINCMALSEDGSVLATGSEDKTARLWSTMTETCECIGILQGHEGYITCIAIEENYTLTGSSDATIRKWDIGSCECVAILTGHSFVVYRMICTGDFIFTSSYDRTCRCWDFDSGECVRVFRGHKSGVYPIIFIPADDDEADYEFNPDDPDGELNSTDILITGSADNTARTWNFETGKCIKVLKEHEGAITCMSTDPGGKYLYTGSTDHTVKGWDIWKGVCLKTFEGHSGSIICMQVVNRIMYTGSSDGTGRSWVIEFGECTRVFRGHKHTVSCIKYHSSMVITGCGDSCVRVFDAKSGTNKRVYRGHSYSVNVIQIVKEKLFTGSHDGHLRIWDISGIRTDTTFGKTDEKDNDGETKVDDNHNDEMENGNAKIMLEDEIDGSERIPNSEMTDTEKMIEDELNISMA